MSPRINFDGVSSNRGDTVPDDCYSAIISGIEPGSTKAGEPKWDVFSTITDGPQKGKMIADQWLLYGKGLGRTKACMSGCGVEILKGDADYLPEDFVNRPILLTVKTETRVVGEKEFTNCRPVYDGYSLDSSRKYEPMARPVKQAKLPGSDPLEDSPF